MMKRPYHALAGLTAGALAAVGLAVPAAQAEETTPVLNEFSIDIVGTDIEFVEVLGAPNADLSSYQVLEIEGDTTSTSTAPVGVVDEIITLGTADADGRFTVNLPANALENGTVSLLLVSDFAGALGADLDTNDDGVLEDGPARPVIVDGIGITDGGGGDRAYGDVVFASGFDGVGFKPGGASRIPDGTDTDTLADWVRNDFDGAGFPGLTGTLVDGEALNTPGAANRTTVETDPGGGGETGCEVEAVTIGSVQGSGSASPVAGATVTVRGVVVGDFQVGGFNGYYVQDAGDGDAATSDGVFVYAPGGADVATGDLLTVTGAVSEFNGLTEITASAVEACDTGVALPAATELTLPATDAAREAVEGMHVALPQALSILEYFNYGRYGEVVLGTERQFQPTAVHAPGSDAAIALAAANLANRITLDDGRSNQNPDPLRHPNGEPFSLANDFRGGDLVDDATGVLDQRNGAYKLQPTQGAAYTAANPRTPAPEVDGSTTVASFNVLNYFTTLGDRGAETAEEFERQEAKIVSAIAELDADIVGLIEIENSENGEALDALVAALNDEVGSGTYAAVDTGKLGTDAITTAFIYKPGEVETVGAHAVLDETVDARFDTDRNRPALAQTFVDLETRGDVTVVVNHLKSKGSACAEDPDAGDGQGNCNGVRTEAAEALADWLATGPTGAEPGRDLIIGDLNSYDKEDPIQALLGAGYTDLIHEYEGEYAYSYVFDGQLGYLDHGLAAAGLVGEVVDAATWSVNADEVPLLDYNTNFKSAGQVSGLYSPDAYRSSDHDPVLIGLDLVPDTTAPELSVTADPALVFPPNGKWRTISVDVEASDDSGTVEVELVDTEAIGAKAEIRVVDGEVQVKAVRSATYVLTYEATDWSGNTTTQEVTIRVVP